MCRQQTQVFPLVFRDTSDKQPRMNFYDLSVNLVARYFEHEWLLLVNKIEKGSVNF